MNKIRANLFEILSSGQLKVKKFVFYSNNPIYKLVGK